MLIYGRHRWGSLRLFVLLCVVFVTVNAKLSPRKIGKFDRPTCKDAILELQKEPNFTKNTLQYFIKDSASGLLLNGSSNMTVTRHGCNEFCGGWSWYWDALPRLLTWILPILLLLSNIELSPIDKKRFMTVFHALGDPIDSLWSLIHKIYIWNRLYAIGLTKSPPRIEQTRGFITIISIVVEFFRNRYHRARQFLRLEPIRPDEELGTDLSRHDRARIIATVLSGFEEISGAKIESEDYYHMITRQLGRLGEPEEDATKFEEWRRTARILADSRTNEFPRTCLAIIVYILGVIAAFIPEVGGGNTSPPGGRIGSAIFLSWLVPLILVSNTIGAFTSRRTCLTIMRQFVERITCPAGTTDASPETKDGRLSHPQKDPDPGESPSPSRSQLSRQVTMSLAPEEAPDAIKSIRAGSAGPGSSNWVNLAPGDHRYKSVPQADNDQIEFAPVVGGKTNPKVVFNEVFPSSTFTANDVTGIIEEDEWNVYFESLHWLGSIYTYRPWKVLYLDIDHRTHAHRKNVAMAFFGFLPVLVSTTGAFFVIWYAVPEGWNCRHIWVLGIFVLWVISAIWTSRTYISHNKQPNGHQLWLKILIKDGIVALISTTMILFSTAGLFNNCWCWSDYMMRGDNAYVPLVTIEAYENEARTKYSIVVGACIGGQLFFYMGLLVWWRHGIKLVRWTESRRRQEWRHEMEGGLKYTKENFLLFWYKNSELDWEKAERQQKFIRYSTSRASRSK